MNKKDRKRLEEVSNLLEQAKQIVDELQEAEQEKFDNLSEGLQASEKGQKFEENADTLSDISSSIEGITEDISMAEFFLCLQLLMVP